MLSAHSLPVSLRTGQNARTEAQRGIRLAGQASGAARVSPRWSRSGFHAIIRKSSAAMFESPRFALAPLRARVRFAGGDAGLSLRAVLPRRVV